MATATKRRTTAPPRAIAGAAPHQQAAWLPEGTGLAWLDGLRERHVAAVAKWSEAIDAIGDLIDGQAAAGASHRAAVRAALASGEPAPPPSADPVADEVTVAIARDDAKLAEETLADVVIEVLAELRSRRQELDPASLAEPLRSALLAGPGGLTALIVEAAREEAERVGELNGIEVVLETSAPPPLRERDAA